MCPSGPIVTFQFLRLLIDWPMCPRLRRYIAMVTVTSCPDSLADHTSGSSILKESSVVSIALPCPSLYKQSSRGQW